MLLDHLATRALADHGANWTRFVASLLRRKPRASAADKPVPCSG